MKSGPVPEEPLKADGLRWTVSPEPEVSERPPTLPRNFSSFSPSSEKIPKQEPGRVVVCFPRLADA